MFSLRLGDNAEYASDPTRYLNFALSPAGAVGLFKRQKNFADVLLALLCAIENHEPTGKFIWSGKSLRWLEKTKRIWLEFYKKAENAARSVSDLHNFPQGPPALSFFLIQGNFQVAPNVSVVSACFVVYHVVWVTLSQSDCDLGKRRR